MKAPATIPSSSVAELRAKYAELRRLRTTELSAAEARPVMTALARRFPGALRELDALPLDVIEERLAALDAVLHESAAQRPWMDAQIEYHALTRGALAAKRFLRGARATDDDATRRFVAHAESSAHPERKHELLAWAGDLAHVARPPRGKLTTLVFTKLGDRLGVSPAAARNLVFPNRARP